MKVQMYSSFEVWSANKKTKSTTYLYYLLNPSSAGAVFEPKNISALQVSMISNIMMYM